MRTDVTSVRIGRLPDSSTSEPYSLIARANDSAAPAAMAGSEARQDDAAEDREPAGAERRRRLLDLEVELLEHRLHRPHDERQRDEQRGRGTRRCRVLATLTPIGLFGP